MLPPLLPLSLLSLLSLSLSVSPSLSPSPSIPLSLLSFSLLSLWSSLCSSLCVSLSLTVSLCLLCLCFSLSLLSPLSLSLTLCFSASVSFPSIPVSDSCQRTRFHSDPAQHPWELPLPCAGLQGRERDSGAPCRRGWPSWASSQSPPPQRHQMGAQASRAPGPVRTHALTHSADRCLAPLERSPRLGNLDGRQTARQTARQPAMQFVARTMRAFSEGEERGTSARRVGAGTRRPQDRRQDVPGGGHCASKRLEGSRARHVGGWRARGRAAGPPHAGRAGAGGAPPAPGCRGSVGGTEKFPGTRTRLRGCLRPQETGSCSWGC